MLGVVQVGYVSKALLRRHGEGNAVVLGRATNIARTAWYEHVPFSEPLRVSGWLVPLDQGPSESKLSTKPTYNTTDLVLYDYRRYNPTLGRWLSRDPIGEEAFLRRFIEQVRVYERPRWILASRKHPYRFTDNNPIGSTDLLGLVLELVGREQEYVAVRCCLRCNWLTTRNNAETAAMMGQSWADFLIRQRGGDASGYDHEALRHCIASSILAISAGCNCAECVGTAREDYQQNSGINTPRQAQRGKNNNRIGRFCAGCRGRNGEMGTASRTVRQVVECCVYALDNGYLDTRP